MKKVEIIRLMDNYTDKEFFFEDTEDSSGTDSKGVKARVMSRVKPFTVKKRIKITAAAAAAAAVLSAAAVAVNSGIFSGSYKTASGITVDFRNNDWHVHFNSDYEPCVYRDGRTIFTALGEDKDITDLIDEKTPYICSYKNSAGLQSYLIVGGRPGNVGFAEVSNIGAEEEPWWFGMGGLYEIDTLKVYGVDMTHVGLTREQYYQLEESDTLYAVIDENGQLKGYRPEDLEKRFVQGLMNGRKLADWLKTAAEYLDLCEAKERMCYDPNSPDKPLPSDEEFLFRKVFGASYGRVGGWSYSFSLEEISAWYDVSFAYESPIEERDGRLWVKTGDEEKDITDLVDENTPYIEALDRTNNNGTYIFEAYLIVGGTPGNYKYVEIFNNNGEKRDSMNRGDFSVFGDEVYSYTLTVDGEPIEWEQLIESIEQGIDLTGRFNCETHWEPWYKAAYEKLNIGYNVRYVK